MGYACSVGAPQGLSAVLCGFVVCFCTGFLAGNAPTLAEASGSLLLRGALGASFGRWSAECLCVAAFGREPSAYHAQLGALFLDAMGIEPACARAAGPRRPPAPADYSLEALLRWSRERRGEGDGAACAAGAPLRAVCGPHLGALLAIGLGLRLLAYALLLRAKRQRERKPPPLCAPPPCWDGARGRLRAAGKSGGEPNAPAAAARAGARVRPRRDAPDGGTRAPTGTRAGWQHGAMV